VAEVSSSPIPLEEISVELIGVSQLSELAAALDADAWVPACDTETVFRSELEVDGIPGAVRVISFATRDGDGHERAFVLDLRDTPASAVAEMLAAREVCGWNANFDEHALSLVGIRFDAWYDAMIVDTVCRAGRVGVNWYRSLAAAAKETLGVELDGKGTTQTSYDAVSDLTEAQVRYAGLDAVVTRRVAEIIRDRATDADLAVAAELELGARPFINAMMMRGVPFDLDEYLAADITAKRTRIAELLAEIAGMTETRTVRPATQTSLFDTDQQEDVDPDGSDPAVVPSWNPNSKADLIAALNRWSSEEVLAYTAKVHGTPRELLPTDSLRKNDLSQIGGPLVSKVLALKAASKEVSTYGADLAKYHRNGRFFSRYKQGGLVSTGRLASFNFNAQNMSKSMLPWMKAPEGRLFVYGDISQAELRFVAHFGGETEMIEAFASGEDFHLATARVMFPDLDLDALATADPAKYKKCRTAAKSVNFGVPYGMAAGLLATNLTVAGVDTDRPTAQAYLDAYFAARPNVAAWLRARDAYVDAVAADLPDFDWEASLELFRLRSGAEIRFRALRKRFGRVPTWRELAEDLHPHPADEAAAAEDHEAFLEEYAARLSWAFGFEGSVLLRRDGTPFEFHSVTAAGRRRHFNVAIDAEGNDKFAGFLINAVLEMCGSRSPTGQAFVAEFTRTNGITVPGQDMWRRNRMQARAETVKAFEGAGGRTLRLGMVDAAISHFGLPVLESMFARVAASCVKGLRNAYRNHPVQGSVADVVEAAFASVMDGLPSGAFPILSVHDSLTIECDAADAQKVARLLHDAVVVAMGRFCPSVVAKVDVDIRTSLADEDVISVFDPSD
jgi:DNA polymerase I-like protein with 3'-5' exonuclease and polymerase domains